MCSLDWLILSVPRPLHLAIWSMRWGILTCKGILSAARDMHGSFDNAKDHVGPVKKANRFHSLLVWSICGA